MIKSLPAPLLLLATALTQALGIYQYTANSMVLSGQVFFPILFLFASIYLHWRNRTAIESFTGPRTLLLGLAVLSLIASIIGVVAAVYWLYPQVIIYYLAFFLLALELAFTIAALPKKEKKKRKESKRQQRRNRANNLVATVKKADDQ
ncbi:MAG: hypothetical protein Q4C74_07930 [Rothia sp. (in: high G+C Gram-positive bacteria)]|nr:hypothetical protein [Rothia sp. (in: high G+C Gram-positive bacteria)]